MVAVGADRPGCVVAIHLRHLDVHQHRVVGGVVAGPADPLHRGLAVGDRVHRGAGEPEDLLGDLAVDGVVLHQEDPHPAERPARFGLGRCGSLGDSRAGGKAAAEHFHDLVEQGGAVDGLGQQPVDDPGARLRQQFVPVIGRDHDHRRRAGDGVVRLDPRRRLEAVHAGHFPVHEHGRERVLPRVLQRGERVFA